MNLNLIIPPTDLAEFLLLPHDVRKDVDWWARKLRAVIERLTPKNNKAPVRLSESLPRLAARRGVSTSTARRKYDGLRNHGWRGLINRAKSPDPSSARHAPEFIEYWKSLCLQNGRKCKPAYRQFVRDFQAGLPIPGIDPSVPRGVLPHGYGYHNLNRYKPTAFELTASRIGRSAAAPFRPKLFTTRVGLAVGHRYIFDDMWHDFKVITLGQRKPARLLQLHGHDLFSGCQFARGLKARLEDPETGKAINLRADEMIFLLCHVFTATGWHPDGTTIMAEHGAAGVDEPIEQLLYDLSAGLIRVERSGIEGASAFAGQYPGRGKGNFRFKAALESLGNLIHNETANLLQFPGQTGSNSRLNLPEELHGRERITDQLSLAMVALPSHVALQLRLPFLEVNLAKWLVEEVMERINRRTDHELQGWLEAGLTTIDFHLPGVGLIPGHKYLSLPPEKQKAIEAAASPAPRKLSPREVFDVGRQNLVRFTPEKTAWFLLKTAATEKTVSVGDDHLITFEDASISPEPLRYLAHHFPVGEKFRPAINPWSPETLHLFDARERWVGVVDAWQTVPRADHAALAAQIGRAAKIEKELLAPLAARGADLTRKRLEDSQHNAGVLNGLRATDRKQALASESEEDAARASLRKAAQMF